MEHHALRLIKYNLLNLPSIQYFLIQPPLEKTETWPQPLIITFTKYNPQQLKSCVFIEIIPYTKNQLEKNEVWIKA